MARIGLSINDALYKRLQAAVEKHETTQSEFLCAAVSCLSDSDVESLLARYRKLRELEKELRREADSNLMHYLQGRTPEEMDKLIETAKQAGNP